MSTPDYVLKEEYRFSVGPQDVRVLPAGTFVRPIELYYVPKHVVDNPDYRHFNKHEEVFCYTRYGIIPIPRKHIRRAGTA